MSRISRIASALGFGAVLLIAAGSAHAGLVGSTVKPIFYADIPELDTPPKDHGDYNPLQIDDDREGPFTIGPAGTTFTFFDYFYMDTLYAFGTFMQVTITNSRIVLTNLIPGAFPEYTAASFNFLSLPGMITGVSIDPSSSSIFAAGGAPIITFDSRSILVNLSNACPGAPAGLPDCVGTSTGGPGESIILNIATVPEPGTVALMFLGLIPLTWRRRKPAA